MNTDIIFIHGLKLQTIIGCLPWEKEVKQTVIIDVDMHVDYREAAKSDNIQLTVDYVQVSECIKKYLNEIRHELVESLSEGLAQQLFKEFPISQVTLKINKPGALSDADEVGVVMVRNR
ncbi:MAG: dihydroneopterin aldolase [Gammaproteobacteria bacterium]